MAVHCNVFASTSGQAAVVIGVLPDVPSSVSHGKCLPVVRL
jgi:hypothetical protein